MTRLTRRGWLVLGAVPVLMAAVVLVASGAVATFASRGNGVIRPEDPCASPPPMQTSNGVTLQPVAMQAFRRAQRSLGRPIEVIESYRSCRRQARACERICQDPEGCPGLCAPPGDSYHQLGSAIDVSEAELQSGDTIAALEQAGWCQSVPDGDPGHFSFGGCH